MGAPEGGFDVERTVYRLTFDDPRFEDFTVDVAAMTVRESWAYNDALAEARTDPEKYLRIIVETLGRQLAAWNAKKGGVPVPATLEGLLSLDDHYVSPIITGWLKAIQPEAAQEPEPDPTVAARSIEAALPMTVLAESNGSVSEPAG